MTRRRFSETKLMARLLEFNGRCAECGVKLDMKNPPEWDHIIPLAMGGEDSIENLQPLCWSCHKAKTATDKAHIAKAGRMERRAAGIGRTVRNPLPGSKAHGWKQKLNGQWVRR
ncbi:MAG: HNH endonuclease signature motif containing protein [Pseudomonadota bacterium]